jgi:hypothetical protein
VLTIVLVLLLLISGANLDFDQTGNGFMPETFPVFAVDWMEKNPLEGNGFNYFPWGGYLLYRIWPENLVFIDGQTGFYGEALTREYEQVITMSAEWHDVLDKYQVSWVLMPVESDLARLLADDRDWKLVYSDQTAAIFDRNQ